MNREIFSKFTTSPAIISAQDIPSLEAFAEQFPYCQLAHFFVAKPHFDLLTVHAEGKIKRAAVFATSRYKLKKFLEISSNYSSRDTADIKVGPSNLAETISPSPEPTEAQSSPIDELLSQAKSVEASFTLEDKSTDLPDTPEQTTFLPDSILDSFTESIKKLKQNEIIDNFIKTEPRITSLAQVSKDPPSKDLSERSIKAPAGLVSENLANIMLKQGKTDKAIEIYEKLILKYPEKKSYFAEKIENLKNS